MEQNTAPANVVPEVKQKSGAGLKVLCVLLALIAIGAIGYIVFDKVTAKNDKTSGSTAGTSGGSDSGSGSSSTGDSTKKVDYSTIVTVNKIISDVEKAISQFTSENNIVGYGVSSNTYSIAYEFKEGYSTNLDWAFGYAVSDGPSLKYEDFYKKLSGNTAFLEKIDKVFEKYGLKKTSSENGYSDPGSDSYFMSDDGYICEYTRNGSPFNITCGHEDWISEEKKDLVVTLIDAYVKKKGGRNEYDDVIYLSASADNIADGENGHQNLSAVFTNAQALFYRNSKDGEWIYFNAAQSPLSCKEYEDEDVRQAFVGHPCYSDNNEILKVGK